MTPSVANPIKLSEAYDLVARAEWTEVFWDGKDSSVFDSNFDNFLKYSVDALHHASVQKDYRAVNKILEKFFSWFDASLFIEHIPDSRRKFAMDTIAGSMDEKLEQTLQNIKERIRDFGSRTWSLITDFASRTIERIKNDESEQGCLDLRESHVKIRLSNIRDILLAD